jgi:hypothetical protein
MEDFKTFVEAFTDGLLHQLPVVLPLSFIFIKLILIRLSGHKEDQWRAIHGIPEDVTYGALAFVIAGLSGDITAFSRYFIKSPHPQADIWTLFGFSVGVCFLIHLAHQLLVLPQYEDWRAADELIIEEQEKKNPNKRAMRGYTIVYFTRFAAMVLLLIGEGALAVWWLIHIAEIIETP